MIISNELKYPTTWNIGYFNDIINEIIAGDWGKEELSGNYTDSIYCIRGMDIPDLKNGQIVEMANRYILSKNHEKKKIIPNDLIIEISGGSPTQSTGRIMLITESMINYYTKDILCTNFCKVIRPKNNFSYFLYYYWDYLYENNRMFSFENGTTGIKNLDYKAIINKERIIIPHIEEIISFNKIIDPMITTIYENGIENQKLNTLRDTLLPKLMSGEIDVSKINFDLRGDKT